MSIAEEIRTFTSRKINRLLSDPSDSATRASLARLRRGSAHVPGELPELWGEFLLDLPESLTGRGAPSSAEWAIYITLTTFAVHQQSHDRKADPMHRTGISLGSAARELMDDEDDRDRVAKRFYPVATATNMTALSRYLRSLVMLLRAEGIPLDYVRLAADLYYLQNETMADSIRLRWGEDFCRFISKDADSSGKSEN